MKKAFAEDRTDLVAQTIRDMAWLLEKLTVTEAAFVSMANVSVFVHLLNMAGQDGTSWLNKQVRSYIKEVLEPNTQIHTPTHTSH